MGLLDGLQDRLDQEHPGEVRLIGVNAAGLEASNGLIQGVDLPWLQDTVEARAWDSWGIAYRDVLVLDARGVPRGVLNLTSNDLGQPQAMATLEAMLLSARGEEE